MARNVTIELEQVGPRGKRCLVKLMDNRELRVIAETKRSRKDYSIDLLALDNRGRHQLNLSWVWLSLALIVSFLLLLAIWIWPHNLDAGISIRRVLLVLGGVLVIAGLLYMFWINSFRGYYFFSRHSGVPLLELQVDKPARKVFREFASCLEERIAVLHEQFQLPLQQQLSGEMRMLRRLADKKAISEADYQKAKEKLLGCFE